MSYLKLNGKELSNKIKNLIKNKVSELSEWFGKPGLGIILVGDRPDSQIYVKMKKKACENIGIKNFDVLLSDTVTQEEIIDEIQKMNSNPLIHGILVQLPLPKHIDEEYVLSNVLSKKDVDGFHLKNIGKLTINSMKNCIVSCTPAGILEILKVYNISLEGQHVVVIGRSKIVGTPVALLALHNNATVTICHSRTKNLKEITKTADILIVACGQTELITREYIKEYCVIIDVGINRVDDPTRKRGYRLTGDVNFKDVCDSGKVAAITPVPGGVGPMTIAMLLKNTFIAYCKSVGIPDNKLF